MSIFECIQPYGRNPALQDADFKVLESYRVNSPGGDIPNLWWTSFYGHCHIETVFDTTFGSFYEMDLLQAAAREGALSTEKIILSKYRWSVDKHGSTLRAALHEAAEHGQVVALELLLSDYSAHSGYRDRNGYTPLALAVMSRREDAVKFLLKPEHLMAPGTVQSLGRAPDAAIHTARKSDDSIVKILADYINAEGARAVREVSYHGKLKGLVERWRKQIEHIKTTEAFSASLESID